MDSRPPRRPPWQFSGLLPALGGLLGSAAGAATAVGGVALYHRLQGPGGGLAVIGEALNQLLVWGLFGALMGAVAGASVGRWVRDR
jgi:hypothetical protein